VVASDGRHATVTDADIGMRSAKPVE